MQETRQLLTWRRAAIAVAAAPVLAWWVERILYIPRSGWFAPEGAFAIGGDFRTLHLAAHLVTHGRGDIVYDASVFQSLTDLAGSSAYGPFANPPPFLVLIAPLGWLSFETAWWVLAAMSVMGIALGLRLLEMNRLSSLTLGALLFPPLYFTITFGQAAVLWMVMVAATYRLLRADHQIAAGAVAGLLVMKPTLAAGLTLWWLLDWRRYRKVALATALSALGCLVVSFLLVPSVWGNFLPSFVEAAVAPGHPFRQWAQFSLWSMWRILFPGSTAAASAAALVSLAVVVVLVVPLIRRAQNLDEAMAAAVLVTVLITPYVIAYDWVLLLVPGVLLWRRWEQQRSQLFWAFSLITIASGWSTVIVLNMLDYYGFAIQVAPLVLLAGVAWYRSRVGSWEVVAT